MWSVVGSVSMSVSMYSNGVGVYLILELYMYNTTAVPHQYRPSNLAQ